MNSTDAQRIGVVEIGGRAIRFLIVEILTDKNFKVVHTDWQKVNLAATTENNLKSTVNQVVDVVHIFLDKCSQLKVSSAYVFGTAAVRRLPKEYIEYLSKQIPNLMVLSERSEALCSLVAAVRGLPSVVSGKHRALAVDQGSRSIELALGNLFNDAIKLINYKSYKLGTQSLIELLEKDKGNISLFQNKLKQTISCYKLFKLDSSSPVIVLGSAATQFAWIKVRQYPEEKYRLHRVHGQFITLHNLNQFIKTATTNPAQTKRIIDPQNASENEYKRTVAGLVLLSIFLQKLKRTEFVVSGLGTRYGLIWLMLQHKFKSLQAINTLR